MKRMIFQTVWLTIVAMAIFAFLVGSFGYIAGLIIGLIPFLYLKKSSVKQVLKVNILSAVISFVILVGVYFLLSSWLRAPLLVDQGTFIATLYGIVNLRNFLLRGIAFLALFNIPILFYFFFGKNREPQQIKTSVAMNNQVMRAKR